MQVNRSWVGRARFPARPEFLFGTVWADSEMHALELLKAEWLTICPYEVEWLAVLPGALVFVDPYEDQTDGS